MAGAHGKVLPNIRLPIENTIVVEYRKLLRQRPPQLTDDHASRFVVGSLRQFILQIKDKRLKVVVPIHISYANGSIRGCCTASDISTGPSGASRNAASRCGDMIRWSGRKATRRCRRPEIPVSSPWTRKTPA